MWDGGSLEFLGQSGFIVQILEGFSCVFCSKILRFLEKEVYTPPATRRHGAPGYFRALSSLSFFFFFFKKSPPQSSYTHK